MRILIKDIPKWLHNSEFYRSLDEGNYDEEIDISYLKESDEVNSEKDLKNYLKTCRFWGIELPENISQSAIDFIINTFPSSLYTLYKFPEFPRLIKEVESLYFDLEFKISYEHGYDFIECNLVCLFNKNIHWSIYNINFTLFFLEKLKKAIILNKEIRERKGVSVFEDSSSEKFLSRNISFIVSYENNMITFCNEYCNDNCMIDTKIQQNFFPITIFNKHQMVKRLEKIIDEGDELLSSRSNYRAIGYKIYL